MRWTDEQFSAFEMIQSMGGSMAQIVLVLFAAGGLAMTSDDLADAAGLSLDTTRMACKRLHKKRLLEKSTISHGKNIWSLGRRFAVLLPTMALAAAMSGQGDGKKALVGQSVVVAEPPEIMGDTALSDFQNRRFSSSEDGQNRRFSSSEDGQNRRFSSSDAKNSSRTEDFPVLECPSSLKTSSSSLTNLKKESTTSREKTDHQFAENLATCATVGIAEPAASQIAAMGHVTPAYILGHVYADGVVIPQAIYRMKRAWRVPTRKARMCPDCLRTWTPAVDAPVSEVCPRCAEQDAAPVRKSPDTADDELIPPEMALEPEESVFLPIGDGHISVAKAWETIKGQLSMEMPKSRYETCVRDTLPISYADNLLKIATRNSFARDWLDSRLSSTVRRLLVGIANRSVDVQFVVAQGVGNG